MSKKLNTPILLIAFNRPSLTKRVLKQIQLVKPSKLYISLDGPRNLSDVAKIAKVKELISNINWAGHKFIHYSKVNLGCKNGPLTAMDWFFEKEEMGIILEDDILADPSFFYYCEILLKRYKHNRKIGTISGNNFTETKDTQFSYMFSRYSQTWGWATWRRVWKEYDPNIMDWSKLKRKHWLSKIFRKTAHILYWKLIFDSVYKGELKSVWDYQWTYMSWKRGLLTIIPNNNLTTNIGIGNPDATHTVKKGRLYHFPRSRITFPLEIPRRIITNKTLDEKIQNGNYILWKEIVMYLLRKLEKIIPIHFV